MTQRVERSISKRETRTQRNRTTALRWLPRKKHVAAELATSSSTIDSNAVPAGEVSCVLGGGDGDGAGGGVSPVEVFVP